MQRYGRSAVTAIPSVGRLLRERLRFAGRIGYAAVLHLRSRSHRGRTAPEERRSRAAIRQETPIPPAYDDETRRWVEAVLRGDFRSPFPACDPEALHDTLRLRGVLPALAELYGRTRSPLLYERIGELLLATVRLIDEHAPEGWDTSTAALRLTSLLQAADSLGAVGAVLPFTDSWLPQFIEAHGRPLAAGGICEPDGNHRLINAVGRAALHLLLAPGEALPPALLATLARTLDAQFLPDGGHVERAPHYQAQVLALVALLTGVDERRGGRLRAALAAPTASGLAALRVLTAPDGAPVRLGDVGRTFSGRTAAADVRAALGDLSERADDHLEAVLPDFGIARWSWRCGRATATLFVDFGPPGLDHNPGHAHADALSFTFYVDAQEVVGDPGTYLYANEPEALWFKRAGAHNTVAWPADGRDELLRFFRWRRVPPTPRVQSRPAGRGNVLLEASVAQRRGGLARRHARSWVQRPGGLAIVDAVAKDATGAVARIGLHPVVRTRSVRPRETIIGCAGGELRIRTTGAGSASHTLESAWYAPAYGSRCSTQALIQPLEGRGEPVTCCTTIELLA